MRKLLYILQLEEYNLDRFESWLKENPDWENKKLEKKQQLNWTLKALLLYSVAKIIRFLSIGSSKKSSLIFAATLLKPMETAAKKVVILIAKFKINRQKKVQVIGITGSYGKTSTKLILKELLSTKYNVLATPHSYNTELGVAKIILKQLKNCHEIFIVEMGAYKKGEIEQICKLVKPEIGIVTGITEQHLERFNSLKIIVEAKFELIKSLPKKSVAVLNADNRYISKKAKKIKQLKITYATSTNKNAQVTATNINIETAPKPFTTFTLHLTNFPAETSNSKPQKDIQIKSSLLGKGQVQNTLAAIAVAQYLKIAIDTQKKIIEQLNDIPHRMQLIDPGNGILILDNAYSSNPKGFEEALNVLSCFDSRRKILVTPGIVELGHKEQSTHYKLGRKAGKIADVILLVGDTKRSWNIAKGIKETAFETTNLHFVKSLESGKDKLAKLTRPKDIILFENDLPDQYT